ncbi:MAG: PH domain-containing protein [Bacteroidota bacterium]
MALFSNPEIEIDRLPASLTIQYTRLAPSYLKVALLGTGIFFLIMGAGLVAIVNLAEIVEYPWLLYGLPLTWLFFLIYAMLINVLNFRIQGYALRQHDVVYRRGVLFRKITTIPFNRVQHCEIKQGPIERMFHLKTLEVYTAGGATSDLKIPGLPDGRAQELKDFIINQGMNQNDESE